MARTTRDAVLGNRTNRLKLPRGRRHFKKLEQGLDLSYRRPVGEVAGTWSSRIYLGHGRHSLGRIGPADDYSDADGVAILSFDQAQAKARERLVVHAHREAGVTGP